MSCLYTTLESTVNYESTDAWIPSPAQDSCLLPFLSLLSSSPSEDPGQEKKRRNHKHRGHCLRALLRKFNETQIKLSVYACSASSDFPLAWYSCSPCLRPLCGVSCMINHLLQHHQAEGRLAPPSHLHTHLLSAALAARGLLVQRCPSQEGTTVHSYFPQELVQRLRKKSWREIKTRDRTMNGSLQMRATKPLGGGSHKASYPQFLKNFKVITAYSLEYFLLLKKSSNIVFVA